MSAWGARLLALAVLVAACAASAWAAWVWQANAYDKQLAEKDREYGREREAAAVAVLDQKAIEQAQRRDLEDRLQAQDKTHWKEMNDVLQAQARLRDRLATADLRLSVLVDAGTVAASGGDGGVRTPAGTGGLVDGAVRAQLDPAHARRIVAITDEGDRAVIALQACQAYVREVTK